MEGANPGRDLRDLQVRCNPIQVGEGKNKAIKVICTLFVAFAIRQYEQFRHRYCGCDRLGFRPLKPRKNSVGVCEILWVGFQVINEDTRVQSDSPVTPQSRSTPNSDVPFADNPLDIYRELALESRHDRTLA